MQKIFSVFLILFLFIPVTTEGYGKCLLSFSVVPNSKNISIGDTITYSVKVKNISRTVCNNVSYSFQYSTNEKYVSSIPQPRSADYYWYVGTLKANKEYTSTVVTKNTSTITNLNMTTEAWATADNAVDVYVDNTTEVSATIVTPPASTTPAPVTPSTPLITNSIQAWIYPGDPACNASAEYSDGRQIDTLKPEYYTVKSDGSLRQKTVATDGCNAYSVNNALDIRAHSTHQYVTVSSNILNMRALLASQTLQNSAITTLTDFTVLAGFTGVELDWEGFGDWTATDYTNYKNFTTALQNNLHSKGKLLMIDAPAISDTTYQSYYLFKYEDFTHIDYIAIMAYDYQYDFGVGEPVTPESWLINTIKWAKARLPVDKIIIGIPSYGYHGVLGSYNVTIDTYNQSTQYPGYSSKTLNQDGEGSWINNGIYYSVQEKSTLNRKKALIESLGIKNISVWHLGGNQWF